VFYDLGHKTRRVAAGRILQGPRHRSFERTAEDAL
jgi:hypothetical protein